MMTTLPREINPHDSVAQEATSWRHRVQSECFKPRSLSS